MKNEKSIAPNAPADFTPTLGNYKDLQPFRYWCHKVLPLVYDDSLSYYELLCKVVAYLNEAMEDVETLHGDITNLHSTYVELQSYVNNYFSSLDVQEEINNKLDNMASSGELYEIIRRYTDPIVNEQNEKINVLKLRMDTFASLPDGSTTGDAELADIRVGYDGTVYPSAGDAVREQVGQLSSDLVDLINNEKNIIDFSQFDSEYYTYDGYKLTALKADTRAENLISYKCKLSANVEYSFYIFNADVSFKVQIYDPTTEKYAVPTFFINGNALFKTFTPSVDGYYTIKIYSDDNSVYPFSIYCPILTTKANFDSEIEKTIPKFSESVSDDVAINDAINFAKNAGWGNVFIPYKNNGYIISNPIHMLTGIRLEVYGNTKIKLADNSNCFMIDNKNMAISGYGNTDFSVKGGYWDGNKENQEKWNSNNDLVVGLKFVGVSDVKLSDMTIKNTKTYGVLFGNCQNITVDKINIDIGVDMNNKDNGDGFHVLGPANNIKLMNSNIRSEDNCIAINADDVNHGNFTTTGNIENVFIDNIKINNFDGGQGMLLLSATHYIKNVCVSRIYGIASYFANISNFGLTDNKNGNYEDISFRDVFFKSCGTEYFFMVKLNGYMKNLLFENINFGDIPYSVSYPNFACIFAINKLGNTVTNVTNLTVNNCTFNSTDNTDGKQTAFLYLSNYGAIDFAIVYNLNCYRSITKVVPVKAEYSNVYKVDFIGCEFPKSVTDYIENTNSTVNTVNVNFQKVN